MDIQVQLTAYREDVMTSMMYMASHPRSHALFLMMAVHETKQGDNARLTPGVPGVPGVPSRCTSKSGTQYFGRRGNATALYTHPQRSIMSDPYLLRARYTSFRILVISRANAGKTTLLQRVCNTTEDPCIYDENNKNLGECS